jgi:hypothetical protein
MWLFCGSPRLCRLRTEGLVPVSKYWTYRSHAGVSGPSKPSSWSSTEAWLKSTASLAGLREKLGTDGALWIVSGALFLKSNGIHPNLLTTHEWLSRMGTARRKHKPSVRGLAWEAYVSCWSRYPLQGVHWFESLWLSDMSNRLFVAAIK